MPDQRERIEANSNTVFGAESGNFEPFHPNDATLVGISAPVQVMVSADSAPFFGEVAGSLAARLGAEVARTPGTHTAHLDRPVELARNIRAFLRNPRPRA